jgi:hypothetical protein
MGVELLFQTAKAKMFAVMLRNIYILARIFHTFHVIQFIALLVRYLT